jgi:hypothetical protein
MFDSTHLIYIVLDVLSSPEDKFGQSIAYGAIFSFQQKMKSYPILSVRYSQSAIMLDVLLKRHDKITHIPLVHEAVPVSTHSVHALLRVLAFWVRHWAPFIAARQTPPLDNLLPDITCLEVDGYMYKAFRAVSARNASMYSHLSVPVECVARRIEVGGMTIIRYPKIEGVHEPQTLAHVCSLLGAVIALHRQQVVHADLRFYNVVFKVRHQYLLWILKLARW